jgi:hypothetical protein
MTCLDEQEMGLQIEGATGSTRDEGHQLRLLAWRIDDTIA